jgi:hypothetical protein
VAEGSLSAGSGALHGKAAQLSSLHACTTFLTALMNPDQDGRIIIQQQQSALHAPSATLAARRSSNTATNQIVMNSAHCSRATKSSGEVGSRIGGNKLIQQAELYIQPPVSCRSSVTKGTSIRTEQPSGQSFTLKYVQLNSAAHFSKVPCGDSLLLIVK